MSVNFTPQAREDLDDIRRWIAEDNAAAAERVFTRIVQTAMLLGKFPKIGRRGQVLGTREFTVTGLPYRIVYALTDDDAVDVVTVMHTSRRYPPG